MTDPTNWRQGCTFEEMNEAYKQAEQQLVKAGRPRPGEPYPRCLLDAGIALAAAVPLVAILGRDHRASMWDFDKDMMWGVVVAIGAASFAVRYYCRWQWYRELEETAKMVAGDLAKRRTLTP
jgi:hypothetical protein